MTTLPELLDNYFDLQRQIYEAFGYQEQWRVFPLDDSRHFFWRLDDVWVVFADTEEQLRSVADYYTNYIYTYRHLDQYVFTTEDLTMILVDTNTDGNKFLQVFDNAKRRDK